MTVPKETDVNIVRLHYGEHWPVGTIAAQLNIHPDVVKRALGHKQTGGDPVRRPSMVQPFEEFIGQTLAEYPRLRATRLYDMLKPRGYQGSLRTLRDYVFTVRPEPKTEAYLRLELIAGEQAQIDWAHVGRVRVPGGERTLWVFVMVLSHSRALWAELVFDLSVESLCRSLTRAAGYFGGVTRQWLFDNPKTVVIERYGDAVRFHPTLLGLCAHFRVQPRLCAVAAPEHKGRVERAIRYLRDRFFAGRVIHSIEQGNQELLAFLADIALRRPHPRQNEHTVADVLDAERPRLLSLPTPLPSTEYTRPAPVDKTAFVAAIALAPCPSTSPSRATSPTARSFPTTWTTTMNHDELSTSLHSVGFRASAEALRALAAHAIQNHLGPVETLEQLVLLERRERERRNLERRTRAALLGNVTAIDRFDWSHPRRIDRSLVEDLLGLGFVERRENVLFRGPSGVGKTMLARCLGLAALTRGHTVRFSTLAAALTDLLKQESLPALKRRLRRYVAPDVLLLDR